MPWAMIIVAAAIAAVMIGLAPKGQTTGVLTAVVLGGAGIAKLYTGRGDKALANATERRDKLFDLINNKFLFTEDGDFPRIRDLQDPTRAGVHRTIRGSDLPEYRHREFDDRLDELIKGGGVIIMHGPSTAGKSRAAYEAIRRAGAERYFVVPATLSALDNVLALGFRFRNAVVWLDNFNPSVDQTVANVRPLLQRVVTGGRTDVTVVFTMWEDSWRQPWAQALRGLAEDILVPRHLTKDEHDKALATTTDPLLRSALNQTQFGLAEYLAAGPRVLDEWQSGRNVDLKPPAVGAAIVSAAVDCWRAGYHRPLTEATLRKLYRLYLNPVLANHPDLATFEDGLAWATTLVSGASSCLIPVDRNTYRPFDYLVDEARARPPGPVPDAVLDEIGSHLDDRVGVEVGQAAFDSGEYALAEKAARIALGSAVAKRRAAGALLVARVLEVRDDPEAEKWFRKAAAGRDPDALARQGEQEEQAQEKSAAAQSFSLAAVARREASVLRSAEFRPRSMDPAELGFTPQRPIAWLAPLVIAAGVLRSAMGLLLGRFLDRRDGQNSFPDDVYSIADDAGFSVDYVATVGDGFHGTYTVANLIGQEELDLDGQRSPRADMLIMGGDEAAIVADREVYEQRCIGPYTAAFPAAADDRKRFLFALPGAGDWGDGLSAFLRVFTGGERVGGWSTLQARSYFAVQLSKRWWIFGLDALNGDLDMPQRRYFARAATQLRPGDRVILSLAVPSWQGSAERPRPYEELDRFIRQVITPSGAEVPAILAGGAHHYSRYEQETGDRTRHLITCGGGSSYVEGTRHLPGQLDLPPRTSLEHRASPSERFALKATYPNRLASSRLATGAWLRLPARQPGLATLLGIVHTGLLLTMAMTAGASGSVQPLATIPLAFMLFVTLTGTVLLAQPPPANHGKQARHWIIGLAHGFAHIGLAVVVTWIWLHQPFKDWTWPGPLVVAVVLILPIVGFVATELLATYLVVAAQFGVNVRELFAAQAMEGFRCFLRIRSDGDAVVIYPIGVDVVCREWEARPDAGVEEAWLAPRGPLRYHLVEPPIRLH